MNSFQKWKSILSEWKENSSPDPGSPREITREIAKWLPEKHIVTISGVRRSGKTTIMFQLIQHLKDDRKIPSDNICYVNCDTPKLMPFQSDDLETFLLVYDELFNRDKKKPLYLFLDEVQNIPHWQKWVKAQYDKNSKMKFILSGSSAELVSSEFSTLLTGRNVNFTVYPFRFREYLHAHGILVSGTTDELWYSSKKAEIKKLFNRYLLTGGFFEAFHLSEAKRNLLLQSYYRDIVHRDILYRHQIRDPKLLEEVGLYLMTNMGNEMSYNNVANALKASVHTVKEYLAYFSECYLLFEHFFFSYSLKESLNRNRKVYCIDHGLRQANSFLHSRDLGRNVENIVFLELKRRNAKLHYFQDKGEIDFIVQAKGKKSELIQVCYSTDEIPSREQEVFKKAPRSLGSSKKIILTENQYKKAEGIQFIPVWLWLLEV